MTSLDATIEYVDLASDMHVRNFSCGQTEIDGWFSANASKSHGRFTHRVTVARRLVSGGIVGFHALRLHSDITADLRKNEKAAYWKEPFFLSVQLVYIAVSRPLHRNRYGSGLLMNAVQRAYQVSKLAGSYGMTVCAVDTDTAQFYRNIGFVDYGPPEQNKLILPVWVMAELLEG
ncbi:hypothetical protein [Pseudochelatococcus contaminans]|uniref:GNAT superfamily N-acetyltransferase n=1 Tax=Pseudochelatococcus contaminans TaxID=1538103 RepID=A0A7W5Z782_9HYPH|nr:hypothetical protein [Pseudochelatococcus contaminans]MBB3811463.1 GNAT superfamily N-acetyltransferase [Pseudochelatococcus contaminans]